MIMSGQIDKTIREFTKQAETFNEYQKSFFKEETKLGKNENVNTEIIEKICIALQCDVSDIMEMADDE